jgi:hypothetical protein
MTDAIEIDLLHWRDKWGLTTANRELKPSANGLRFTAESLYICKKYDLPKTVMTLIDSMKSCQKTPGLYMRTPDNYFGQEGPDDYHGVALASFLYDPSMAREVLAYGQNTFPTYYYKNSDKAKLLSPWLGRMPQLIAALKWAAGYEPTEFEKLYWMGVITASAFDKQQDSKMLSWALCKIAEGREKRIDRVIAFWRNKFRRHYPYGAGQVMGKYFGNPNHPSAKYLIGDH